MDISLFRDRARQFKNLLESISKTKGNGSNPKTNPEALKIAKGIVLCLLAVFLAWICKSETERQTREQTLQEEWPTIQTLHAVLHEGGWKPVTEADFSLLLKNHPDPFSEQSMIWGSEDHCLIYLRNSKSELWSCATSHRKTSKIKWHKIGSGYAGVNLLSKISLPKPKITASYIDPKEIRY